MIIKNRTTQKTLKTLEKISKKKLTFGNLLWSIRSGEEESQQDFAEKLGLSKHYLSDLECGRRTCSLRMAAEYARRLGYSEKQFVRLCLQDMVDKEGLEFEIDVLPVAALSR